jgi:hypothetical protein
MQSSEGEDPRVAPLRGVLAVWGLTADIGHPWYRHSG